MPVQPAVALSRGRQHNVLYLLNDGHRDVLARDAGQRLASDTGTPAVGPPRLTPQQRQLDRLRATRDDARHELSRATDAATDAREHLWAAEAGLGRLTRRHALGELRRQAVTAETAQARWQDRLNDLDDQIDRLERQRDRQAPRPRRFTDDDCGPTPLPDVQRRQQGHASVRDPDGYDLSM